MCAAGKKRFGDGTGGVHERTSVRAIEWRKAEGTDAQDSAKKSEHAKEIKSIECKRIKLLLTNFFL